MGYLSDMSNYFENIANGQTVTLKMAGSVQGLTMRAVYDGEVDGVHTLHGVGVMSDATFGAVNTEGGWTLTNGRTLFSVEKVSAMTGAS